MPSDSCPKSIESADHDDLNGRSAGWIPETLPILIPGRKRTRSRRSSGNVDGLEKEGCPYSRPCTPTRKIHGPEKPSIHSFGDYKQGQAEYQAKLRPLQRLKHERLHRVTNRRRAISEAPIPTTRGLASRRSAPDVRYAANTLLPTTYSVQSQPLSAFHAHGIPTMERRTVRENSAFPFRRSSNESEYYSSSQNSSSVADGLENPIIRKELEARWILNLSLAFRDKSDQEKFFITYAEQPNRWRRVTVSCDYSNAPEDSLEADLKSLRYQRDKSAHIYEAIRDSLSTIEFYDTVTNLKLETADNRLHVHVTEDVNEIINYPPLSSVQHLRLPYHEQITEERVHFVSHISGFVYQVDTGTETYIKKEIPGPDMVDEFLYEVNALCRLRESSNVIDFCALVVDSRRTTIRGLLISFAKQGALVDLIYDHKITPLLWPRRDKWIRQIVAGLSDIHEAGFVQGDFTLSNIVIDDADDAKIIDINRRGCPVGWEPPEFIGLIASGQRISMYIGTKSDLYQLGMVLWALSVPDDEPERAESPLSVDHAMSAGAPEYLRRWMSSCLSENPANRRPAIEMLADLTTQERVRNTDVTTSAPAHEGSGIGRACEPTFSDPSLTNAPRTCNDDNEKVMEADPPWRSRPQSAIADGIARRDRRSSETRDIDDPFVNGSTISGMHAVEEPESLLAPKDTSTTMMQRSMFLQMRQTRQSASPRAPLSPPLHQDSGFGAGEEHGGSGIHTMTPGWPTSRSRAPVGTALDREHTDAAFNRIGISPPVHQDSGFDEMDIRGHHLARNRDTSKLFSAVTTDEFAGIGAAHAEHSEDRTIYVA